MNRERIHNILDLCMEAKKKGYDCFFSYNPHVSFGQFCVTVYLNGWDKDVVPDRCLYLCADGKKSYGTDSVDEVEEYLKGLI